MPRNTLGANYLLYIIGARKGQITLPDIKRETVCSATGYQKDNQMQCDNSPQYLDDKGVTEEWQLRWFHSFDWLASI